MSDEKSGDSAVARVVRCGRWIGTLVALMLGCVILASLFLVLDGTVSEKTKESGRNELSAVFSLPGNSKEVVCKGQCVQPEDCPTLHRYDGRNLSVTCFSEVCVYQSELTTVPFLEPASEVEVPLDFVRPLCKAELRTNERDCIGVDLESFPRLRLDPETMYTGYTCLFKFRCASYSAPQPPAPPS